MLWKYFQDNYCNIGFLEHTAFVIFHFCAYFCFISLELK